MNKGFSSFYEGPNAELVNEVIIFAFSNQILASIGPDEERGGLLIITDMRRAVDAAGGVGGESEFPIERDTMQRMANMELDEEDCSYSWLDLRGNLSGYCMAYQDDEDYRQRMGLEKKHFDKVRPLFMRVTERQVPFEDHLVERLPEGPIGPDGEPEYYRDYIINEVRTDMLRCAKNRFVNGANQNFWELLLQVYMQGLWPCGWMGTWPAPGKFIAWRRRFKRSYRETAPVLRPETKVTGPKLPENLPVLMEQWDSLNPSTSSLPGTNPQ